MSCCVNKNYYSPQKKRILLLNTAEIRRKTQVRQPYCNLYAYAGNNPVKYTDPDGNSPLWFGLGKSGFGHEAPQRFFGFKDKMDDKSWCLGFDLHATSFETDNFTLRLWKGNYGNTKNLLYLSTDPLARTLPMILGGAGGEIGLYNPDGSSMSKSDLAALGNGSINRQNNRTTSFI
ncbi:hypothetical protein [Treponema parvum]|uniref:hypothetical protein n=1 Tax=Treponema parvum TaxID=138851 RepID=UPI001AEBBFC9|nr:hypothetical protein [Treponema parvum]QTQ16348.1 hypothetical protein HXT04_06395 [Treponema parvum]